MERGAVDALLGSPPSGWEGALQRSPSEAHAAGGGPGGARPAPPSPAGAAGGAIARRLDQRRRPQLHLPETDHPAGRGLRRRVVLRAAVHGASATRSWLTSATISPAGRTARRSSVPTWSDASVPRGTPKRGRRRCGRRAHVSGCARGRRLPFCNWRESGPGTDRWRPRLRSRSSICWPSGTRRRPLPTGARAHPPNRHMPLDAADRRTRPRRRGRTTGNSACCAASATSIRKAWTTTGLTAATRRCAAPSSSGRRVSFARSSTRS